MRDEYDFSKARRASEVPHLAKLQAQANAGKTRITIMLDDDVIAGFRSRAQVMGCGYQTEINRALKDFLRGQQITLESVRQVMREELHAVAA
jgi:uncharacterized protein (DUF4415 family)